MERSSGAIKTTLDKQVVGRRRAGRPRMTWRQVVERDMDDWNLSDPHDRVAWQTGVRAATRAASQLSGGGTPAGVFSASVTAR